MEYFPFTMLLTFSIFINTLLLSSNHPMMYIFILVMITLLTMIMSMITMKSSLLTMLILLMMLGGLLILFIYIASISPSDTLIKPKIILILPLSFLLLNYTPNMNNNSNVKLFNQLYLSTSSWLTILMISILLFSLFIILKLINKLFSPLSLK